MATDQTFDGSACSCCTWGGCGVCAGYARPDSGALTIDSGGTCPAGTDGSHLLNWEVGPFGLNGGGRWRGAFTYGDFRVYPCATGHGSGNLTVVNFVGGTEVFLADLPVTNCSPLTTSTETGVGCGGGSATYQFSA